ncbi:aminotransferase class I/II-fold pyridoxal phosphate-dependent enzyme [Senegalia massiliensis]|uniref:Aminotransferase class V-fold PLP-dependent enzyme n=1 Tax=Senegalia massiliensis TaxID=1720316 RepID=A0A845QWZ5_9CLOT|nr:aminotransferase class I/II-fold pyridoxal phosphate-dependent enzyme [Senegalia massiliensis]NBI06299.1 aminotransferase class V-fold PLP-dependent enzyme [Senegalia massiliensis]
MNTPLIKGLLEYSDKKNVRFHMPGHKGRTIYDLAKLIPDIDVTEVEGTDNLHNPKGVINESQKRASNIYGTRKTFYSVNGTTAGIYAAITSSVKPGEEILIQRNCHKSIYNALVIGRIKGNFIYPKYDSKNNILTIIDPNEINDILSENKNIKAVVITYPSYLGICSDIKTIADVVHKHDKILIVDEAHGSHLEFSNKLPISAESAGADIIVQSTHKTLPSYTQSSMVHVNSDRVDNDRLFKMMSMFQSTSPSYILMSSLDMAMDYMINEGKNRLEKVLNYIDEFTYKVDNLEGISLFVGDTKYIFDKTKIVINATELGLRGSDLENILRKEYNIELEMSDLFYALAMVSVMNTKKDLDKLYLALKDISNTHCKKKLKIKEDIKFLQPTKYIEIYEAFNENSKFENLDDAIGEIASDYIIPYPPGVPVVAPGEILSKDIINHIKKFIDADIEILGLNNNKVSIIDK